MDCCKRDFNVTSTDSFFDSHAFVDGPIAGSTAIIDTPFSISHLTAWAGVIQLAGNASFGVLLATTTGLLAALSTVPGTSVFGALVGCQGRLSLPSLTIAATQQLSIGGTGMAGSEVVITGTIVVPATSALVVTDTNLDSTITISGAGNLTFNRGVISGPNSAGITITTISTLILTCRPHCFASV
jgi:hypothetical protein